MPHIGKLDDQVSVGSRAQGLVIDLSPAVFCSIEIRPPAGNDPIGVGGGGERIPGAAASSPSREDLEKTVGAGSTFL